MNGFTRICLLIVLAAAIAVVVLTWRENQHADG